MRFAPIWASIPPLIGIYGVLIHSMDLMGFAMIIMGCLLSALASYEWRTRKQQSIRPVRVAGFAVMLLVIFSLLSGAVEIAILAFIVSYSIQLYPAFCEWRAGTGMFANDVVEIDSSTEETPIPDSVTGPEAPPQHLMSIGVPDSTFFATIRSAESANQGLVFEAMPINGRVQEGESGFTDNVRPEVGSAKFADDFTAVLWSEDPGGFGREFGPLLQVASLPKFLDEYRRDTTLSDRLAKAGAMLVVEGGAVRALYEINLP